MLFDLPVCANEAETGTGECLSAVHVGFGFRVGLNVVLGVGGKSCRQFHRPLSPNRSDDLRLLVFHLESTPAEAGAVLKVNRFSS